MNNRFVLKIKDYIEEKSLLSKGDRIVLGVSGGADSVALFLTLYELKEFYEFELFVVHVNHGLREEAYAEAEYVKKICEDRNIQFFLFNIDVTDISKENAIGIEEAGRKARYEAFYEVLKKTGSNKIAVAHNSNDRAETLLFNLARGTGIKGLASIPEQRGEIVRPLLCVKRDEIESFLKETDIRYCTDSSNLENDYTRNRIRNIILPSLVKEVNENSVAHIAETAAQLTELFAYADQTVKKIFEEIVLENTSDRIVFSKDAMNGREAFIQKQLIKEAIDRLVPGNRDITHRHINSVVELLSKSGTKKINLPYSLVAEVSYETISLCKEGIEEKFRYQMKTSIEDYYKGYDYGNDTYSKCFDYGKLTKEPVLRTRQAGDYIIINDAGGKKKLKDYMIDNKIPVPTRDYVPIVAVGSEVLWVVGYRMSEAYKLSDNTESVIRITVYRED